MAEVAKGEDAMASAAAEKKKKGEGAVVSEAMEKLVEKAVSEAMEKLVKKAVENVFREAAKKVLAPAVVVGKREGKESAGGTMMITLKSSDGDLFLVTEATARESVLIGNMIDAGFTDPYIPLRSIDSRTLKQVIEYCDEHGYSKSDTDEEKKKLKEFDEAFIDELAEDKHSLFHVIMAARHLKIGGLVDLTCKRVDDMTKGKTDEEIREIFNIKSDLSDEEEEESAWAWGFDY